MSYVEGCPEVLCPGYDFGQHKSGPPLWAMEPLPRPLSYAEPSPWLGRQMVDCCPPQHPETRVPLHGGLWPAMVASAQSQSESVGHSPTMVFQTIHLLHRRPMHPTCRMAMSGNPPELAPQAHRLQDSHWRWAGKEWCHVVGVGVPHLVVRGRRNVYGFD